MKPYLDGYPCEQCTRCDGVDKGKFGENCDGVYCKRVSGECTDLLGMDSRYGCVSYEGPSETQDTIHLENLIEAKA